MVDSSNFGVGAQVFVRSSASNEPSPWPMGPSGIVVRSGGSALSGVWGRSGGGRLWWIEFDEPQTNSEGDGPFRSAQVHEKFLELAPPITGDDSSHGNFTDN
ncbi:MAG TPA: hypothetical protein VGP24_01060 [Glaciihabitans sp.]|jgi:hypothetical protein|nr:hypothetical protein [Glaciihabitans sp.]